MKNILTGKTNYAKIAKSLYQRAKYQQKQFGRTQFEISDFNVFQSFLDIKPNAIFYDITQVVTALNEIKGCNAVHKIVGDVLEEEDMIELTLIK